jgi:hypothetical protein
MNNLSSKIIVENLPNFNKDGEVFNDLFGIDPNASPIDPYILSQSISPFNSEELVNNNGNGAITNSTEWHIRMQGNSVESMNLNNATGVFLDIWGDILGVTRLINMKDSDYKKYIKSMLFGKKDSIVGLAELQKKWGFLFSTYEMMGFALGLAFLDEPIRKFISTDKLYGRKSSVLVDISMNRSIILTDTETSKLGQFDDGLINELLNNMAVGTEYYIGIIRNLSFHREKKVTSKPRYVQNYIIQKLGNMPEYEWVNPLHIDFKNNKDSVWEKEINVITSGNFNGVLLDNGLLRYDVIAEDFAIGQIIKFCKSGLDNGYFYVTPKSGSLFPDFNTDPQSPKNKFNITYNLPSSNHSQNNEIGYLYLQRNNKDEFLRKFIFSELNKKFVEIPPYYEHSHPDYLIDPRLLAEMKFIATQRNLKTFSIVKSGLIFYHRTKLDGKNNVILASSITGTKFFQYVNYFTNTTLNPDPSFIDNSQYAFNTVKIGEFKIWN